jgi:hypothetical protein
VITLLLPIEVTPAFVIVTSPETATAAATLEPFPIIILPSDKVDPIGETPEIVVVLAFVILPLASTVIEGTAVEEP